MVAVALPDVVAFDLSLQENKTPGAGWFELAVMHHTDCGSGLFADDVTVPGDVDKLVNAPQVSPAIKISGFAYDVKTGLVTTIVPPRSRQDG